MRTLRNESCTEKHAYEEDDPGDDPIMGDDYIAMGMAPGRVSGRDQDPPAASPVKCPCLRSPVSTILLTRTHAGPYAKHDPGHLA